MARRYWTGSHTKHRLRYHVVRIPKFRRKVLQGKTANRLLTLLYQGCEVNGWWIHEIKILPDNVHMLIQIPLWDSLAHAMQILKGGTSKKLREEFPELEEFLWGDSFWSEGYFAESVGAVSGAAIRQYIKDPASSMPERP